MNNNERAHESAAVSLRLVFGNEYDQLKTEDQKQLIRADYLLAFNEDHCTVSEYKRRIGKGNLQAYANCLSVKVQP